MSLFSTLSTASSGLSMAGTKLAVIGDNIANINTIGFKGARAQFADLVARDSMGLSGPTQIGTGGATDTVSTLFGQGSITESQNALDLAISGNGFFSVRNLDQQNSMFTRDGQFALDESGYIVSAGGMRLQGFNAEDDALSTIVTDLKIDRAALQQQPTETLELTAVLSTEADFSTTPIFSGGFTLDGNTDSVDDLAAAADFATSINIYDSLGAPHNVTIAFERQTAGDWGWYAVVDGGEVGETEGAAFQIASGSLSFDGDGDLTGFTQVNTSATLPWNFTGAEDNDVTFEFGLDGFGAENDGDLRAISGPSAVTGVIQDGYGSGDLIQLTVDQNGNLNGTYTNGEDILLGQVALAEFPSYAGLKRVGRNLYQSTQLAGDPAVGTPGTGTRGNLISFALEQANVDLEDQFVDMIQSQRTYQANARVITTTDGTLQELVQLL
ncbi:MAG: flagellar hook protein FlgE [Myxococcota bacterium]|nr:flagellar hook protein FlgE [Myxococcota bacterium]